MYLFSHTHTHTCAECNAETAGLLFWPDTLGGTTRTLQCLNTPIMVNRTCSWSGVWESVDLSLCTLAFIIQVRFSVDISIDVQCDNIYPNLLKIHLSGSLKKVCGCIFDSCDIYENKPTSHTVIFLIMLPNAITAKDVCLHLLVPHFAQYWLLWLFSNVLQH